MVCAVTREGLPHARSITESSSKCVSWCPLLQALLGTQLELPDADLWAARVQQIHDTWADNLYTRDRDITPGELGVQVLGSRGLKVYYRAHSCGCAVCPAMPADCRMQGACCQGVRKVTLLCMCMRA